MKNLLTVSNRVYIRMFLYLRFVPAVGYAMITLPNIYMILITTIRLSIFYYYTHTLGTAAISL